MAWWEEIIEDARSQKRKTKKKKGPARPRKNSKARATRVKIGEDKILSTGLTRAIQKYFFSNFHNNFIDILYVSLSVFTYLYIILSAITFAFQNNGPPLLAYAMDTLSEPYLGTLAIYVLVKEIEHRRSGESENKRHYGELFVVIWLSFLIGATIITTFSNFYHFNKIYQTVATNSLASVIIQIGSLLR